MRTSSHSLKVCKSSQLRTKVSSYCSAVIHGRCSHGVSSHSCCTSLFGEVVKGTGDHICLQSVPLVTLWLVMQVGICIITRCTTDKVRPPSASSLKLSRAPRSPRPVSSLAPPLVGLPRKRRRATGGRLVILPLTLVLSCCIRIIVRISESKQPSLMTECSEDP